MNHDIKTILMNYRVENFHPDRKTWVAVVVPPTQIVEVMKQMPESIPPFDFTKCPDLALFFLLVRLKWYMRKTETYPNIKARVFINEGYKKNAIGIRIPTFEDVFADGQICFAKSSSIYPIQLADFAAFFLNRVQLIGGREH